MRRSTTLLGLLLLATACGPGGFAVERPAAVAPGPSGAAGSEPVPTAAGGSGVESPIAFAASAPWSRVTPRLQDVEERAAGSVVLQTWDAAGPSRSVVWSPRPPPGAGPGPDLGLVAALSLDADDPCVEVSIHGPAWPARYGCAAPTRRRVSGWGADARPGLAALLDEALAAVDGDPGRLRVVFRVTPRACAVLTWGDVYPLVEEAILTRATAVIVEDGGRAEPGLRLIGGGDRTRPSLDWLAAHQATDGRWAAAGFGDTCDANPMREPATGGAGHPGYDVGTTGLSLLAFLGAGYTNRGRHKFARTVWKGLRFLKSVQRGDGGFVDADSPWAAEQHAIATLALLEAYRLTGSPLYEGAARHSLAHLPRTLRSGAVDDLPSLAFAVAALASSDLVNEDAFQRGRERPYRPDPACADELLRTCLALGTSPRPDEAAVGLFGRILLGGEPGASQALQPAAAVVLREPPCADREARIDAVHWLFGTLALYRVGGPAWKAWSENLRGAVVGTQRTDGAVCCARGSWDPVGPVSGRFGRVGATALRTLCLEIYYRYDAGLGWR